MMLLVLLATAGLCFASDLDYSWDDGDVFFAAMDDNPFIKLLDMVEGFPSGIQYLQPITQETGLMVRVFFSDDDGPLDANNTDDGLLNICDILNNALSDPNSTQARYNMASPLGLAGSGCPIPPGVKPLTSHGFPLNITMQDLGCGVKNYHMRVENANGTLESEAILELRLNLQSARNNETCIENSSINIPAPSIVASIVAASLAIAFSL